MASTMNKEIQAILLEKLPYDMIEEIEFKVGQSFHHGFWSAWRYDRVTRTLVVELGKLYDACDMEEQITAILLHIDMGLANILVLRSCLKNSIKYLGKQVDFVEQIDLNIFKNLVDFIDTCKVGKIILDDKSIDYLNDY